jgi:hypothetical protein
MIRPMMVTILMLAKTNSASPNTPTETRLNAKIRMMMMEIQTAG